MSEPTKVDPAAGPGGATVPSFDPAALADAFGDAVARAAPAVVRIARRRGGGSGLVWSDQLVVTSSYHAADELTVGVAAAGGATVERTGTVIGRDPGTDVAVVRVDGGGLAVPTLRDLDGLGAGHLVFAVARPGRAVRASLRAVGVLGPEVRTPAGGRLDRYLETDRALPRGFAGGPLVDVRGQVVGMNTRTLIAGADLCVPVATLRRVVDAIVTHGRVARGYLGVGAYPVDVPAALAPGRGAGALVASVEEGGPAAAAGLVVGDIIVAIAGEPVAGPGPLRLALADRAGVEVTVELIRGGAPLRLTLTVGTRP